MLYLDGSATTKPSELAIRTFVDVCRNHWGNPSSTIYDLGNDARLLLEGAREKIARCINAEPEQIFFTSGSTEGANWIIQTMVDADGAILTSRLEHPCVYNAAKAMEFKKHCRFAQLDNDKEGHVSYEGLVNCLYYMDNMKSSGNLVCIMESNNEIGTRQDIASFAKEIHRHRNSWLLTDMTQSFAHLSRRDVESFGFDFAIASAQKFGGLKGTGFLYARHPDLLKPFLYGGHQERCLRAGTENVAGIVSMAEQFEAVCKRSVDDNTQIQFLRMVFLEKAREYGWRINGDPFFCLPNIISVTVPGLDSNRAIAMLGMDGIYLSAGSACTTESVEPSRILRAIGLTDEEARSTLRITLSPDIKVDDVEAVAERINLIWQLLKDV